MNRGADACAGVVVMTILALLLASTPVSDEGGEGEPSPGYVGGRCITPAEALRSNIHRDKPSCYGRPVCYEGRCLLLLGERCTHDCQCVPQCSCTHAPEDGWRCR